MNLDYAYRIPTKQLQDELVLPNIPITPIGYEDAAKLLVKMDGQMAPPAWQGTLPGVKPYRIGPLQNG